MKLSIIIPTYNEAENIGRLISYLHKNLLNKAYEIIVSDGGSTDSTFKDALKSGATVLNSQKKGRASQMNYGASKASGEVLYFLHADSYPPATFHEDIFHAVKKGIKSGSYRLKFDYNHWFLKFNSWFTRFDIDLIRFGDQSLFISKEIFDKVGGFDETLIVMEDMEIIPRIKKLGRFKVMNAYVRTSARKYLENGIYKLQAIFFIIYFMYWLGFSQEKLIRTYRSLIKQNKV